MWPTIGDSFGVVVRRDLRSSFSPSFSLPLSVSLLRFDFLESGSTTRVTDADSLLGLGVVSLSFLSCCRSLCSCFFLSFHSPEYPLQHPLHSLFHTKQTPHTPLTWPTRVLARTPVCVLNTLMLEFARSTTSHDLSRAKKMMVDGMASSGLASKGAMRGRVGGKTGVMIWEFRSFPPCRQLRPV
jgi:hypothetical protein